MGSGSSRTIVVVTPALPAELDQDPDPICDPCVNQNFQARGWCTKCHVYLCTKCVAMHTRSHKIALGSRLPRIRPMPDKLIHGTSPKIVTPVAILEDVELVEQEVAKEEQYIRACVSVDRFILTITLKRLTLYDEDMQEITDITYTDSSPISLCARDDDVIVSFERPDTEFEDIITPRTYNISPRSDNSLTPRKKPPPSSFKDVQMYKIKDGGCSSPGLQLVKGKCFSTDGECFTTAVCPEFNNDLHIAAGMRLDFHPHRDDIEIQVQILKSNGKPLYTLELNPIAEPCFTCEFFLCTTANFLEIIISEVKSCTIRGINIKTGKTLYQFKGGTPQGLTCDSEDNVYAYTGSQIYWIPPSRRKLTYIEQGDGKKAASKDKDQRMAVCISFNDKTQMLYKSCIDRTTIETFTIV